MDWQHLLSAQRFKISAGEIKLASPSDSRESSQMLRTDFHIDYDRVTFSHSFRKLGRKTQVHPFSDNDHTHNRLTHSVEVASVGRSLGNRVGILLESEKTLPLQNNPSDIGILVQVASLAHDIGNPPFGHVGEDALRDWFKNPQNSCYIKENRGLSAQEIADIQNYEGNAHSLRIVSNLEMYKNHGGMRLSAASIGTLIKYPWTSSYASERFFDKKIKFNIYQTELAFFEVVAAELGLKKISSLGCWMRHPLSYLMEAADDICYALMDLEDAVELELLTLSEVKKVLKPLAELKKEDDHNYSTQQKCAMLRGKAIGKAIIEIANTFIKHKEALLNGDFSSKDLISVASDEVKETLDAAKTLAKEKIFSHRAKLMTEIASFPCLQSILSLFIPAVYAKKINQSNVSDKVYFKKQYELALKLLSENNYFDEKDNLYMAYMKVLDYVGGMTDNFVARLAREVSGIGMIR